MRTERGGVGTRAAKGEALGASLVLEQSRAHACAEDMHACMWKDYACVHMEAPVMHTPPPLRGL